jgi:hypothetical protein
MEEVGEGGEARLEAQAAAHGALPRDVAGS